jgi:predicted nucleotidyltransferase
MNIHISKEKYDWILKNSTIIQTFKVGSVLYDLNDENSDKDFLIVIQPHINQVLSPFSNHHQFQYKDIENNTDINIVDVVSFVRNLVSGDSLINFELLYSEEIKDSELNFLANIKNEFRTYNIIKAYLGVGNRDIKMLNKRPSEHDKLRGVLHIQRSFMFAKMIYGDCFQLKNDELKKFKNNLTKINYEELNLIKSGVEYFRKEILNKAFERKEIHRVLDPGLQEYIEERIVNIVEINQKPIDLTDNYLINENVEIRY